MKFEIPYYSAINSLMMYHRYGQPRDFSDREACYDRIILILNRFTDDGMDLRLFDHALRVYDTGY